MLIGVFRPAIILPDREYTNEQLNAVLLHELTHLRRNDVLVKWLSVVATALHSRYEATMLIEMNIWDIWNGDILSVSNAFLKIDEKHPMTLNTQKIKDSAEMSGAAQYMETLFAEYTNPIADSRITLFEKTGEFNDITSNNLAVWQLEFDYLPVDPDAFNRASDVRMESDGWVTESEVSRVFLVFSYDNGTVMYLGAISRLRHDLHFPLYERQGQEQALQVFIDELTKRHTRHSQSIRDYDR